MKIPKRIEQHRPFYKGIPVPYSNYISPNGTPDFRVIDPSKTARCFARDLCGICGMPLDKEIVFVGGPLCRTHRIFTDPAMHEECAKYAFTVCPYLLGNKDHTQNFKPKQAVPPGTAFVACPHSSNKRPDQMFLFYSTGFDLVKMRHQMACKSFPFTKEVEMK